MIAGALPRLPCHAFVIKALAVFVIHGSVAPAAGVQAWSGHRCATRCVCTPRHECCGTSYQRWVYRWPESHVTGSTIHPPQGVG
ncbi:protein of unknown function (plasmid) [Cupriavidus taiwanensis]|uniref:Uncharacterized protein n=1 Tax=Cupriavidus taiwanensis TaxID=164546 RepID=A0A7Z7JAA9_9BURK|nr:protein of unknown function [Cupriavidus taiwanensis]SOZ41733.1 protein of unknown function [Cupriavidus taiwanensis]SPC21058.1 protein of unknown function [Cupriavidus taiwanensis]SPD55200.1 protein of unknown function [Cupriavidus taiwanensis]